MSRLLQDKTISDFFFWKNIDEDIYLHPVQEADGDTFFSETADGGENLPTSLLVKKNLPGMF